MVATLLNTLHLSLQRNTRDQFKSEISLHVMTENELDHVQIRVLLLKGLDPLNADKAGCPDGMCLQVLDVTSEEMSKAVADLFPRFGICFRGLASRFHYLNLFEKIGKQNITVSIKSYFFNFGEILEFGAMLGNQKKGEKKRKQLSKSQREV